jgi:hypothetical protein
MPPKRDTGPTIHTNDNLQTLYVDGAEIRKRNDGMHFIRFTADLPEGKFEQFRIIVDEEHLQAILDIMCSVSNYYPEKPVKPKQAKTRKKP